MGAPAYHPRALLSVWLYGFMTGVRSCRKLEVACRDQIPYLWLTGWQHPDHNALWRFYKKASAVHEEAIRANGKHGGSDGASGFGGPGGGWDEGILQRLGKQELRCCGLRGCWSVWSGR